jgi:hypothetical protein
VLAISLEATVARWVAIGENRDGGLERMNLVNFYRLLAMDGFAVEHQTLYMARMVA